MSSCSCSSSSNDEAVGDMDESCSDDEVTLKKLKDIMIEFAVMMRK